MSMDSEVNREVEQFHLLLEQLRNRIMELQRENRRLADENDTLRKEQSSHQRESEDIFSVLGESERIALRHQVQGLITKIDKHLG